jgi:hypothetical protein
MVHNLKLYLKKYHIKIISSLDTDGEDIMKAFLKGFFLNVAQKQMDNSYRSIRWDIPLYIHPTSVLYTIMPECIFYNEVVVTAKNYIKDVSTIKKEWILEIASHYYEDKTKKVINERHREEVLTQQSSINKPKTEAKLNSFKTGRIYMESEKNKVHNYNFDDSDEDVLNIKPEKQTLIPQAVQDDDEDNITMLRRMRKRK